MDKHVSGTIHRESGDRLLMAKGQYPATGKQLTNAVLWSLNTPTELCPKQIHRFQKNDKRQCRDILETIRKPPKSIIDSLKFSLYETKIDLGSV